MVGYLEALSMKA